MKKQSLENKLVFAKTALVELNDNDLNGVNGGSTPGCYVFSLGYLLSQKLTDQLTECRPD